MNIKSIPNPLLSALNDASRGRIDQITNLCDAEGWELDLSCVTYLNGLPAKEMRLCVTAFHGDQTTLFIQAPLGGAARKLGWNLYLTEKLATARRHVDAAHEREGSSRTSDSIR
jgi:hypothetical protein